MRRRRHKRRRQRQAQLWCRWHQQPLQSQPLQSQLPQSPRALSWLSWSKARLLVASRRHSPHWPS
eukprot:2373170-Prymnesium_polylepis.1